MKSESETFGMVVLLSAFLDLPNGWIFVATAGVAED